MNVRNIQKQRLEDRLAAWGNREEAVREHMVRETVEKCVQTSLGQQMETKSALWEKQGEEEQLSFGQFFWVQSRLIKKSWWLLQALILMAAWIMLDVADAVEYVQRELGLAAALFVILAIPEIWKNRTQNSMEIESAAFYSLRQVYAAKILAFGLVDICMLTIFCFVAARTQSILIYSLLKQFVFPLMVATGICFAILCSKRRFGETAAIFACIGANGLWALLLATGDFYDKITPALWRLLFGLSGAFIFLSIRKTLRNCEQWEVYGNEFNI